MRKLKSGAFVALMILIELILLGCDAVKVVGPQPTPVVVAEPSPAKSEVPPQATPSKPADPGGVPPGSGGRVPALPLAWEDTTAPHPERRPWSELTWKTIEDDLPVFSSAKDVKDFCPRFHSLSDETKIKALAELAVAMTFYESGYDPLSRMRETNLDGKPDPIDPITGTYVYSEGLLQLSYQDIRGYPFCALDWKKDKGLAAKDPRKTILDPFINLSCGLGILKKQIQNRGTIAYSGSYWSVLRSGKYSKLTEIRARVKKYAPACN